MFAQYLVIHANEGADASGQEVLGKQTVAGIRLNAISVSKDEKWVVCGTEEGASMWDEEIPEKVAEVEGKLVQSTLHPTAPGFPPPGPTSEKRASGTS